MLESGSTPREYCLPFLDRLLIVLDNISFEDIFLLLVYLHNILLKSQKNFVSACIIAWWMISTARSPQRCYCVPWNLCIPEKNLRFQILLILRLWRQNIGVLLGENVLLEQVEKIRWPKIPLGRGAWRDWKVYVMGWGQAGGKRKKERGLEWDKVRNPGFISNLIKE